MRRVLIVACAAALLGGCGDEDSGGGGESPRDVVLGYLQAVADGDGGAACAALAQEAKDETVNAVKQAVPSFKGSSCEEAIEALHAAFDDQAADTLRNAEVESTAVKGDTATVKFKGGLAPVELERTDDGWVVARGATQ